jgi:uncharacterized phage protein gp47/JayE
MPVYGLTTEGFLVKTLDIIRNEIGVALQQAFGPSIRLDDESILGQIVGIVSERLALLWELAEVVNSGYDPDAASGASLEQLCLITGTQRPVATYSAVTLTLAGVPTTAIPAGSKVRTVSTLKEFQTTVSTTIGAAEAAWVAVTAYVAGDRVTANDGVYECVVAGTSAATSEALNAPDFPNPAASPQPYYAIVDGTVTWVYLGVGTGSVDVTATAVESGPVVGSAYDINEIVNGISGWGGAINLQTATTGRDIATDAELRLLREQELATGGSSPINALRAELLAVPDVLSVSIFQNNTDADLVIEGGTLPPHSVEALVRGPVSPDAAFDQSIFDALLDGVAAGIKTHGTVAGWAVDDEQTSHYMKFSRPTNVPIYVDIEVTVDPTLYPDDGDDQIKTAILAYGEAQATGKDVTASRIMAAIHSVTGVLDVTQCFIDDAAAPTTSTTIAISKRQLATFSLVDIAVLSVDGTP